MDRHLAVIRVRIFVVMVLIAVTSTPLVASSAPGAIPGERRAWTLEFRTRLEQPGQQGTIEVALSCEWTSTIVAVRSGEYDVALGLAGVHLTGKVGRNVSPEALEGTQRRLNRRFWATYRNDGALLAIHFFKDVDPSDRNLLQMIATETQFVRPEPGRMVWNALERDGAGNYLAIYNWAEPNVVVKRKLKYVHTDSEPGAPADRLHVDMDQSELRFSFDTDGEIHELKGSERSRIGLQFGNSAPLVAVTTIHLANLRRSMSAELIGSLERARPDVVSSPIVTHNPEPEKLQAQRDDELLEGQATESLLEAARLRESEDHELSARLAALFRRRPEAIPTTVTLLRENGQRKRLTDALGAAHTPAAIAALTTLAQDQTTATAVRIDALTALVFVQHPSLEAMRIPVTLFDDSDAHIASAARIMGGAVSRAGRKEHPAEADALDTALITRYRKGQETRELSDLLAALGNSVGPSVLPVIEEALHDPRVPVRAAAARALRLAEAPETDALLSATITDDGDPQVRDAAIFAVSFRHATPPLGEALIRAAKEDPVEYVRSEAVVQLRAHPQASPETPETLAWIAEHDPKPGIRRLAREALTSISR